MAAAGRGGSRALVPLVWLLLLLSVASPGTGTGPDVAVRRRQSSVSAVEQQCQCIMLVLRCENHSLRTLKAVLNQTYDCVHSESYVAVNVNMNNLTSLDVPDDFFRRNSVSHFWADGNHLQSLEGLAQWTGHYLAVGNNQLTQLNRTSLARLQVLSVENNMLRALDLTAAHSLRHLNAANNIIQRLDAPDGGACALQQVVLARNYLSQLPAQMRSCSALRHLDVSSNRLTAFDLPQSTSDIRHLQRRIHFPLDLSRKTHFPLNCSLETLDLSRNNVSRVTDALAWCSRLRRVDLSHNNLTRVPVALLLLMVLRPRGAFDDGVLVDLRGNPLESGVVKEDFARFLSVGYGHDLVSPLQSPGACECATMQRLNFAPVTYCVSSMCHHQDAQPSPQGVTKGNAVGAVNHWRHIP